MTQDRSVSVSKIDTGFLVTSGSRTTRLIQDDNGNWQALDPRGESFAMWPDMAEALRALIDKPSFWEE